MTAGKLHVGITVNRVHESALNSRMIYIMARNGEYDQGKGRNESAESCVVNYKPKTCKTREQKKEGRNEGR